MPEPYAAPESQPALRHASILGPVLVRTGDGSISPRGPRAKALVVLLALAEGKPLSADALITSLWSQPDLPRDPRATLQSLVSRLRQATWSSLVASTRGGYSLGIDSDVAAARRGLRRARARLLDQDPESAYVLTRDALDLWRGEPGSDLLLDDVDAIGRDLEQTASALHDSLLSVHREAALAAGEFGSVIALAAEPFESNPTDENSARDLMRAYAGLGRRAEALRVFARLRHALTVELGTDPGPDLAALAQGLGRDGGVSPVAPSELLPAAASSQLTQGRAPAPATVIGLRTSATPLLGRASDVQAIEEELIGARLVTVLGTGGLGKTRLAQEVARRAATTARFVAVVELAGIRSDDDVILALADTLGVGGTRTGRIADQLTAKDLRGQLMEFFSHREGLLVLDNCEHVIDGATRWADDILAMAPQIRILTTSRSPLRLPAEQVYPLRPLAADDGQGPAIQLFVQRAHAVRPDVTLPMRAVTRLCERLDGLPLAIELAAARVRTMSVEDIEKHLGERFALLRSADRLAPDRHKTLEAVIEWSWNLLHERERRLLRRICVLPDGVSTEAAVVLGATGQGCLVAAQDGGHVTAAERWRVLDAIDGLVAQSLLQVTEGGGSVRYRLLETVREFGALRLSEAGEQDVAMDAVFGWASTLAADCTRRLLTPDQVAAVTDLRTEQENLLFALRRAGEAHRPDVVITVFAALNAIWLILGSEDQIMGLIEMVFERVAGWEVPDDLVSTTVMALLVVAGASSFIEKANALRALARVRRLLRRDSLGRRTRALAELFMSRTSTEGLRRLARMRDSDDPYVALLALFASSQAAENAGNLAAAVRWGLRAYDVAMKLEDTAGIAICSLFLSSCYTELGEYSEVEKWTRPARSGLLLLGAEDAIHQLDWHDLAAAVGLGDSEKAASLCGEMAARCAPGSSEQRGMTELAQAELAFLEGREDDGLESYRKGHDAFGNPGEGKYTPQWLLLISSAWLIRLVTMTVGAERAMGRAATDVHDDRMMTAKQVASEICERMSTVWTSGWDFVDYPVTGTVVLALGTWRLAHGDHRGLAMIALAQRMGSRQDIASLRRDRVWDWARDLVGSAAIERAQRDEEMQSAATVIPRMREFLKNIET